MKNLKRIISLLLVLINLFALFACGEYNAATGIPGISKDPDDQKQPEMNNDPSDDFTVTVTVDGQPYTPRMEMYVIWTGDFSVHKAPLDRNGVARIDGLDGDYHVTLSAVPNEYTYNPNGNVATNERRNITVELRTLNILTGGGSGFSDCYTFNGDGVYTATIKGPDDSVYFEFAPSVNGVYTIESWADTKIDNVNPYVKKYDSNSGGWVSSTYETYDDGGPEGSYTKNFVYEVKIADQNISSGGQVTFKFVLKAETKNNIYPTTITINVQRNEDYDLPESSKVIKSTAVPELDFSTYNVADHEYAKSEYTKKYLEYPFEGMPGTYVFDDRRVKLWKKVDGGDGFYHVYDAEKYEETGGYGPILYANITSTIRSLGIVETVCLHNNAGYTDQMSQRPQYVFDNIDYTHFIHGYTFLTDASNFSSGGYYCVTGCKCHFGNGTVYACPTGCTSCSIDCRQCPPELIGNEGYQSIANSDGMVAVTEELKVFLEKYVKAQSYFLDGKGTIDMYSGYQAVSDSGWLYACIYYEAKQ